MNYGTHMINYINSILVYIKVFSFLGFEFQRSDMILTSHWSLTFFRGKFQGCSVCMPAGLLQANVLLLDSVTWVSINDDRMFLLSIFVMQNKLVFQVNFYIINSLICRFLNLKVGKSSR